MPRKGEWFSHYNVGISFQIMEFAKFIFDVRFALTSKLMHQRRGRKIIFTWNMIRISIQRFCKSLNLILTLICPKLLKLWLLLIGENGYRRIQYSGLKTWTKHRNKIFSLGRDVFEYRVRFFIWLQFWLQNKPNFLQNVCDLGWCRSWVKNSNIRLRLVSGLIWGQNRNS